MPSLSWWWSALYYYYEGAGNVGTNNYNGATGYPVLQPTEGFENAPIEDEKGKFHKGECYISKTFRKISQLKRYVRPVIVCGKAANLEPRVTLANDERHIPIVSTKAFILNLCSFQSQYHMDIHI